MAVDVFSEYPGQPQKKKRRRRGKFPFIKLEGWTTPDAEQPNTRPPKPRYHVGRGSDVRVGKGDSYAQEAHDASADEAYAPPPDEGDDQGYSPPPPDEPAWQPPVRDIAGDYTPAAPEYTPPTPYIQRKPVDVGDYELPNQELFTYDSGEPGDFPVTYKYADGRVSSVLPEPIYSTPSARDLWKPGEPLSNDESILFDHPMTNESTYFANDRPQDSYRQALGLPDTGMQGTYPKKPADDQFPSFENTILRPILDKMVQGAGASQIQGAIDPLGVKPFRGVEVPEYVGGIQIPPNLRAQMQQQLSGDANLGSDINLYLSAEEAATHAAGGALEMAIPATSALKALGIHPELNTGLTLPGGDDPMVLSPRVATDFIMGSFTPSGMLLGHVGGLAAGVLRNGNIGKAMLIGAAAAAATMPDIAPEIAMAVLPGVLPVVARVGLRKAGINGFSDEFLPVSSPSVVAAKMGQTILAKVSNARWLPLVGAVSGAVGGGTLGADLWAQQQGKPDATLADQLTAAVAGAVIFGGLGWFARREAAVTWHKLNPIATGITSNDNSIWMPRNSAPVSLERRQAYLDAQKAEAGHAVGDIPPFYYPGGTHRFLWDKYIRGGWSDDAAYLNTFESAVKSRRGGTLSSDIVESAQGTAAALPKGNPDDKTLGANLRAYEQQMLNHGVDGSYEHWAQTTMAPIVEKHGLNDSVTMADFNEWANYFMSHERATGAARMSPQDFGNLFTPSEKQTGPNTATVGETWVALRDFTRGMVDKHEDPTIGVKWTQALKEITGGINGKLRDEAGSLAERENVEQTIANQPWLLFARNVETHPAELAQPKRGVPWIAMSPDLRNAADQQALTIMSVQDTMNAVRDRVRRTKQAQMMNYTGNLVEEDRVPDQKGLADTFIKVLKPEPPPERTPTWAPWETPKRTWEWGRPDVEAEYTITGNEPRLDTTQPPPGGGPKALPDLAQNAVERTGAEVAPTTQHAPGVEEPRVGTPAFPEHGAPETPGPRPSTFRVLSEDMPQPTGPHAETIIQSKSLGDIPRDVQGRLGIHERDMVQAKDDTYRALAKDKSPLIGDDTWRARAIKDHGDPADIRDEDVNALRRKQGLEPYKETATYPQEPVVKPKALPSPNMREGMPGHPTELQGPDYQQVLFPESKPSTPTGPQALPAPEGVPFPPVAKREPRFGPNPDGKGGTVWHGDIEKDSIPNGWEVIKDFRNGKEVAYLVPDDIEKMLHGRSPMWVNAATRFAQVTGTPFRMASTVLSPGFGLFRNMVKDVQEAGSNLGITGPLIARWPEMWLATVLQPEFQNVRRRGAMYLGAGYGALTGFDKDSRENAGIQERAEAAFTYGALGALATNPQAIRKFVNALKPGRNTAADVQQALPMAGRVAETNPLIVAMRDKLGDRWTDPWGRLTQRIEMNQRVMSEAMSQGVRIGTVSETMRPGYTRQAEHLLGVKQTVDRSEMTGAEKILSYLHEGIGNTPKALWDPFDMVRSISEIGELASKGSVYRVLRESPKRGGAGLAPDEATLLTRGASVDFSKSGSSMRIINMFLPLIGAREQGTLRSVKAWNENPAEFTLRAVSQWGLPSAAVQAYWRSDPQLSDLYDKIPEDDKIRNWILPSGATYSDPKTGDEKAIYYKVPKSPIATLFSMPVEHVIDLMVHTKNHGIDLQPGQRTERSAGHKWAQGFVNMLLPYNADERSLADPMESLTGLAQMSPAAAYYTQKYANWNEFMDQPLVPDAQMVLPKRFQVGTLPNRGAVQVSERLRAMGVPEWLTPSPVDVQLAAKTFGGTLATQFLGALDQVIDGTGIMPDVPTWAQQQERPPGISQESWRQYLDSLNPNQNNAKIPRWAEATHSIFTGFAGGQQTIAAKIKEMSPQERTQWEHTQALFGKAADWKTNTYLPELQRITNDPSLTPAARAREMDKLNAEKRSSYDVLKGVYTEAILNPKEREEFKSRLPGVPVTIDQLRSFQDLPDTLDPVAIEDAWYRPRGLDPETLAALRPAQLQALRQTELTNLARAHEADPKILKDYINAIESKREMKVIGVAANWLDDAVNRYQRPGYDAKTPDARLPYQVDELDQHGNPTGQLYDNPVMLRAARQAEMQKMSTEYGVDTNTLTNRINLRMSGEMVSPIQHSRRRAQDAFADIHDPLKYAPFIYQEKQDDGTMVDVPLAKNTQMAMIYENEIAEIAKVPPAKRTAEQNFVYDAKKRGDLRKWEALQNDPRERDYDRWYGVGKNMTDAEWMRYQNEPRYKDAEASDNRVNDLVIKLYLLTPAKERPEYLKKAYAELQRRKLPNFKNTDYIDPLTGELTPMGQQLEDISVGGGQDIRTGAMADAESGPVQDFVGGDPQTEVGLGADDDGDGIDDDTGEPVDQPVEDQVPDLPVVYQEDWTFDDPTPDQAPPDAASEPFTTDLTPDSDVTATTPARGRDAGDLGPSAPSKNQPLETIFPAIREDMSGAYPPLTPQFDDPAGDVRGTGHPWDRYPFDVVDPSLGPDRPSGADVVPLAVPPAQPELPEEIQVDGWRQWLKQEFGVEDDTFPWDQTTNEELLDYLDGTDNVQDARRALQLIRERIASGHVYVPSSMRRVY